MWRYQLLYIIIIDTIANSLLNLFKNISEINVFHP